MARPADDASDSVDDAIDLAREVHAAERRASLRRLETARSLRGGARPTSANVAYADDVDDLEAPPPVPKTLKAVRPDDVAMMGYDDDADDDNDYY